MDEEITYRTATADDAMILCELGQLLNAIHHAARPDIYTDATEAFARDLPYWASFFEHAGQVVFIADHGRQAVGFITATLAKGSGPLMQPLDYVRIGSVCVAEQFWGKGVGRALMKHVQDWAIKRDAKDLRLAVWTFNTRAARMYTELGFETRAYEMGMRL
jgi:GNAT superfamily N-acetyltransferase